MSRPALSPAALSPAMFSIVLGTGGVSLCSNLLGLRRVALALLGLNVLLLSVAWAATLARILFQRRALWADLTDLARGPAFFFAPLATGIFGVQIAVLTGFHRLLQALWIFTLVVWIALCVSFVVGAAIRDAKATFAESISPTWLLPGAALIVTMGFGTHVVAGAGSARLIGLYGGLLFGFFLNLMVTAALLGRWLFLPLKAGQVHANNWINMGGFAIVVVAALKLAALQSHSVAPGEADWIEISIRPLVIFSWVLATWWIPILAVMGIWRHGVQRVPYQYELPYWALVFSPSVYALATAGLILEYRLDALRWVPPLFIVLAALAWLVLMFGFVRSLFRRGSPAVSSR